MENIVVKDINGNNVEISREEIAKVIEQLRYESPKYLETFSDFVDWVSTGL